MGPRMLPSKLGGDNGIICCGRYFSVYVGCGLWQVIFSVLDRIMLWRELVLLSSCIFGVYLHAFAIGNASRLCWVHLAFIATYTILCC